MLVQANTQGMNHSHSADKKLPLLAPLLVLVQANTQGMFTATVLTRSFLLLVALLVLVQCYSDDTELPVPVWSSGASASKLQKYVSQPQR